MQLCGSAEFGKVLVYHVTVMQHRPVRECISLLNRMELPPWKEDTLLPQQLPLPASGITLGASRLQNIPTTDSLQL
jgi:hypothetical protein